MDLECQQRFEELKTHLTTALIVRAPNWQLPFEVMCDASDLAVGAVLGQMLTGSEYAHKFLTQLPKDYYLIPEKLHHETC